MNNKIEVSLPDGTVLIAEPNNDPAYPGIQISIRGSSPDYTNETLCFVEYNKDKPSGKEICICAYTHDREDYVYYASYNENDSGIK